MTIERLQSVWIALAKNLSVHPKTIARFRRDSTARGLPFLTHMMPELAKSLDRALTVEPLVFKDFSRNNHWNIPIFLRELFELVFDRDGYLLPVPDPVAIKGLRQLLYLFYKMDSDFTAEQLLEANEKFIKTDISVWDFSNPDTRPASHEKVRKAFISLLPDAMKDVKPSITAGASAEKVTNIDKPHVRQNSLAGKLFGSEFMFVDSRHKKLYDDVGPSVKSTGHARVVHVPKTVNGPRTISCEPHETMMFQKGLQMSIYTFIELSSPAKGYINFTDQEVNRDLAYIGSLDGSYATIDLKDASDLVSSTLIESLMPAQWWTTINSCRTPTALIETGHVVDLKKFAPMGSALCFPIEAMLFWSIAKSVSNEVYVYGDDIIVKSEDSDRVTRELTRYGLVINDNKTLTTGLFRESCGAEYYAGHDISYVKFKSFELESYVAFANLISEAITPKCADKLITDYEKSINSAIYRAPYYLRSEPEPFVFYTEGSLASNDVFFEQKFCKKTQQVYIRRLLVTSKNLSRTLEQRKKSESFSEIVSRIKRNALLEMDMYAITLRQMATVNPLTDHFWKVITSGINDLSKPLYKNREQTQVVNLSGRSCRSLTDENFPVKRVKPLLGGHVVSMPQVQYGWSVHYRV